MTQYPVIGLIPAGGLGTRISPLPMSKELYPLGLARIEETGALRPKVVSEYLLDKMRLAGIDKAFFILRPGKWDIPAYFGDGTQVSMNLGYLIMGAPYGVPFTLDQAYPFVQGAVVALGFPDILFHPDDAYRRTLERLAACDAEVVLGLFPTEHPHRAGMVDVDAAGRVKRVLEKPKTSSLRTMWATAVWKPPFTDFLHRHVRHLQSRRDLSRAPEIPIGDVIQAAIIEGMRVEAVSFDDGHYLDIGTPGDLMQAAHRLSSPTP